MPEMAVTQHRDLPTAASGRVDSDRAPSGHATASSRDNKSSGPDLLGMHAAVGERRCIHLQQRPYPDVWNSRRTAHCVCVLNVPAADKEGQRLSCDAESLASYGGAALMHSPTTTTTTRGACSLNGEVSDNNLITHLPSPTPALLVSSISVRGRRPP